jgi:hypothetical protein
MGMLFKLIGKNPHLTSFTYLNPKVQFLTIKRSKVWQQFYDFSLTILNFTAMNRKATIRHHGSTYHENGIGTVTIVLAAITVAIIFYSIITAL